MRMDENFLRYSGLDSACTLEAHNAFWDKLDPDFRAANDLTMQIMPVLMFMQSRGIKIDLEALSETKVEVIEASKEKQKELDQLCGRPLNVNSPKDCQSYFYEELGIPAYKNKDGKPTVDDLALQRLVRGTAARPGLRQAKLVQEIRGLQKLYGTYLNLEFDADGRLRCSYNPRGTKFGRLSSSKTIFGTGTNFQNLPQEFKKFLAADDGYVFVEVDKRQAEWVAVAYLTGDANMLAAIENGVDVHTHTAHEMFGVSYEIIKREHKLNGHTTNADIIEENRRADPAIAVAMAGSLRAWPRTMSLRQCGKKSNHGLNYDEGPNGFAMINEIEIAEAKRIVNMYHTIYPGIRLWYESIKQQLKDGRTLTNCFGRTIRFLGAWNDDLWKSAYSALPQSTIVDGVNIGMESIYESDLCQRDKYNADVLAQVHDSILLQVPITSISTRSSFEYLREKIRTLTSADMQYNGRTFQIASDFKFGINWGGFDKDKNPGGMQEFEEYDDFLKAIEGWEKVRGPSTLGLVG